MSWTIERKIFASFTLAVLMLAGAGGGAWWISLRLDRTMTDVDRSHHGLRQLQRIFNDALEMQSGSRGFALTGDERFLGAFAASWKAIGESLAELRRQHADNPGQSARADELARLTSRLETVLRERNTLRRTQGLEAAAAATLTAQGFETMAAIRRLVADFEREESALLAQRSTALRASARLAAWSTGAAAALAAGVMVAAARMIRSDFRLRRQAEDERDRFFTLSLDLLCIAGADGYFKRVSPAFTQTLGWSAEELLARPFVEFVHPDDRAATLGELDRQVRAGAPVLQFENRYAHKDGSWRTLSWKSAPQPDGLLYASARDVTAARAAEQKLARLAADLQRRSDLLEAANQELEAFSYSVSHDLRAPLRHIDGYVQMVNRHAGDALAEKPRRYLGIVTETVTEMGRLIDDLLEFSRTGRAELRRRRVALDPVVDECLADLARETEGRAIEWVRQPLPEVHGDAALLKQVLLNLLANAVKYSRPRAPARIEIGAQPPADGEVVLFVRDNGVGFDMQYAGKLFGVFQRLHHADEFEGTGIGLATVRRIIARHSGRVWAESAPGAGATFFFSLPLAPPPA